MMLSNVAAILLFSFLFARSELIDIKTFGGDYEETESTRMYKDEWKIIVSVNLTKYKKYFDEMEKNVKLIRNCCEELNLLEMEKNSSKKGSEGCGPILNQLNMAMTNFENNNNNMLVKSRRFKPNDVSELILIEDEFRKMSAKGAKKCTKSINKTSFISSTLNSIARSFESSPKDDFITNELSLIQSTMSAVKNGSVIAARLIQLQSTIKSVVSYQKFSLSSFILNQKQYLKITSLVGQRNPIIPNVLKSNIITEELGHIRDIVSQTGLDLSEQITSENLFSFDQSAEVQMFNDQIYIGCRIPLISIDKDEPQVINIGEIDKLFRISDDMNEINIKSLNEAILYYLKENYVFQLSLYLILLCFLCTLFVVYGRTLGNRNQMRQNGSENVEEDKNKKTDGLKVDIVYVSEQ